MAETIRGKVVIETQMPVDEAKKQLAELQKTLDGLKIPKKLAGDFSDTFKSLNSEIDKLQKKLNTGLKTNAEITSFEKTSREVQSLYNQLDKLMVKLSSQNDSVFGDKINLQIENIRKQVASLEVTLSSLGKNNSGLQILVNQFGSASKYSEALKKRVEEFKVAMESGDFSGMAEALRALQNFSTRYEKIDKNSRSTNQQGWIDAYTQATAAAQQYENSVKNVRTQVEKLNQQALTEENRMLQENRKKLESGRDAAREFGNAISEQSSEIVSSNRQLDDMSRQIESFVSSSLRIFTIAGAFQALRSAVRSAYSDVKELDAAMNSIAVVTDYSTKELWGQVEAYAELAQQMGVSLTGVYEVQKLFYQQGRSTADVAELTSDTLKLARIAEMDYSNATDAMTVALNAFKLEASDATKVIDIYSQLASHAAVSQKELATAMSKVASMASSVGMSLETTSAFLAQIIETTRESPETA